MATTKRQQRLYRRWRRKYYPLFDDNNGVDEVGVIAKFYVVSSLPSGADLSFLRRIIWSFHVEKSLIGGLQNIHISANIWNFDKIKLGRRVSLIQTFRLRGGWSEYLLGR